LVTMARSKTKTRTNPIWSFFSSVKLTIVLLIVVAISSVLGTVIPQGEGAVEFARRLGPDLSRILFALGLFDMYHTVWFRLLLACLTLNLVVCSIHRFPSTWKRFSSRPRPDRDKPFERLPEKQSFIVKESLKGTCDRVEHFLRSRFRRIDSTTTETTSSLYMEKGRCSHFGFYLVHLSVLMILIGGFLGSFLGFEGYVNIVEGEQVDTIHLRKGMASLKLGFEVRCDEFTVDFYESGAPKEYRSEISFLVQGREVEKRSLLVNHPVEFRGVTFYQSSYGTVPGKKARLTLSRSASETKEATLEVELGKPVELPGKEGAFRIADIRGDFMRMGPAVLISVRSNQGHEVQFWVFKEHEAIKNRFPGIMDQFPKLNASAFKPYTFHLNAMDSKFYTGLQANRDPGVPFVWLGCFIMVVGFFVTFFASHRRIWVRVSREDEGVRVSVAGNANRNPVGLERELEHLRNRLKALFSP